ncbi:MAG: tRNA (adenosine(37)-N6)-threonylcarbamoyltransferase complex dimerization subunit type 1 TsaB [Elusimicrobia bacterium]|nr:tRNA (adenosine(37)-N6)-threonylcarbamoyltransferase complex dimerization subunit type 1 TsaB [Elusimicrobiota bacterium]
MTNAIAIETSGTHLSYAILRQGKITAQFFSDAQWDHEQIFWKRFPKDLKKSGLKLENLDFLAATRGPGRFTGVRLGLAIVNTWASLYKIPVFAPTVPELMAWQHRNSAEYRVTSAECGIKSTEYRVKKNKKEFSSHSLLSTQHSALLCLVAFSGAVVLTQTDNAGAIKILKTHSNLEEAFKNLPPALRHPLSPLLYYCQENLEKEIANLAQKHNVTARREIPRAGRLLEFGGAGRQEKSRWIKPPKLAQPLYLKQSWG